MNIKKYFDFKKIIFLFSILSFLSFSYALQNPEVLVKTTVTQLQKDIQAQKASLKSSPVKLYNLVQKDIIPNLDVNYMAGLTLGNLWKSASAKQKSEFVDAFARMLTRAYASALLKVSDYSMSFKPVHAGWKTKIFIAVSGTVTPKSGGQPTRVVYYLVNMHGHWKIYDFVVEGISFLENYRSQFQSFSDIKTVTQKIKDLNKRNGL